MSHRNRKPVLYAISDADASKPAQPESTSMSKVEIAMISAIVVIALACVFMSWAIIAGWMPT